MLILLTVRNRELQHTVVRTGGDLNMDFAEAIRKAIEFEREVQALYEDLAEHSRDGLSESFYRRLAQDEAHHVQFFHRRLKEWLNTGQVTYEKLAVAFDARRSIAVEADNLVALAREREAKSLNPAVRTLLEGLKLEEKATRFYREVSETLDGKKRDLFLQFVEVETSHENMIKRKMAQLLETGKWS